MRGSLTTSVPRRGGCQRPLAATQHRLEQHVRLPLGDLRLLRLHHQVSAGYILQSVAQCASEELGQRPVGCPGLDTPFEEWPLRNYNSPIWHSRAMSCGKQTYRDLATIVERWDQVITNIMSVIMILCQVRL